MKILGIVKGMGNILAKGERPPKREICSFGDNLPPLVSHDTLSVLLAMFHRCNGAFNYAVILWTEWKGNLPLYYPLT